MAKSRTRRKPAGRRASNETTKERSGEPPKQPPGEGKIEEGPAAVTARVR